MNFGENLLFIGAYYSKDVCPYVFLNSPLQHLSFEHITNSLIYKNQLEFVQITGTDDLNLLHFRVLIVNVAYEHITHKLIVKNVFKNVRQVHLMGYFYGIEADLFDLSFKNLKEIHIVADNLRVCYSQISGVIEYNFKT